MKAFRNLIPIQIILIMMMCIACTEDFAEECSRYADWKTLTEEEAGITCEYQQIYLYKNQYYTLCVCCVCDKAPMAIDCNGDQLCDFDDGCMKDFLDKAEYQFRIFN